MIELAIKHLRRVHWEMRDENLRHFALPKHWSAKLAIREILLVTRERIQCSAGPLPHVAYYKGWFIVMGSEK